MRMPGFFYRTPVVIQLALGNTGDGQTYGPTRTARALVKSYTQVAFGADGATRYQWTSLQLPREDPISVGDLITVDGMTRPAATVERVRGPGGHVTHIRVQAGNG